MLSEGDNIGARYLLMSLYAFLEDELNVIRRHKRYNEESSSHILLPIIALYYKLDNYKKAEAYLKKLRKVNDEQEDVFSLEEDFDDTIMDDVIESGMYQLGSKEELMTAMADAAFLYTTSSGFYLWMADRISHS